MNIKQLFLIAPFSTRNKENC